MRTTFLVVAACLLGLTGSAVAQTYRVNKGAGPGAHVAAAANAVTKAYYPRAWDKIHKGTEYLPSKSQMTLVKGKQIEGTATMKMPLKITILKQFGVELKAKRVDPNKGVYKSEQMARKLGGQQRFGLNAAQKNALKGKEVYKIEKMSFGY